MDIIVLIKLDYLLPRARRAKGNQKASFVARNIPDPSAPEPVQCYFVFLIARQRHGRNMIFGPETETPIITIIKLLMALQRPVTEITP